MPNDLLAVLASNGTTGVVGALGMWVFWKAYQREVRRCDRLETELRSVRVKIEEKFLPAILEASRVRKELAEQVKYLAGKRTD